VITEMTEQMKALGKDRIRAENEKLKPIIDRMLSRKKEKKTAPTIPASPK